MQIFSKHTGHTRDGIRRAYKGGGDPGAAAREQEAERQARIKAATEAINGIFGGQTKTTQQRYVADDSFMNGPSRGQTLSPEEYAANKARFDELVAKSGLQSNDGLQGKLNTQGKDGAYMAQQERAQAMALLSPEEQAFLNSFNPNAFKAETYDVWANGDNGGARQKMYEDHRGAVYDLNKAEVDRQATEAERAARFGLARTGLAGGSADIDAMAEINRRTNEGLLRSGGIADASAAELKSADERTRSNLLSMAQSGIDTGSAATMALQGLKVNADSVAAAKSGATIGGLFNDMGQAYLSAQGNVGRSTTGQQQGQQWYGVSAPQQTYAGN